jgi:hypothetical protein
MNGWLALVLDPTGVIVAFAGGGDDGGIAFNCNVTTSNRADPA